MRKGLIFLVWMLLVAGTGWAITAEDQTQFEQANLYYREGLYEKALPIYQDLSHAYEKSAKIFYNLGNVYVRLGKNAQAILAYERAKILTPRDQDLLYNLAYVKELVTYHVEDKRNWYLRATEYMLALFTRQEIYSVSLVFYFLLMSYWVFCLMVARRGVWNILGKIFLMLFLLSFSVSGVKYADSEWMKDAIVMKEDAPVRYGPSVKDQVAFQLGEGLKVQIIKEKQDWSRILLANQETGWVQNALIAKVEKNG